VLNECSDNNVCHGRSFSAQFYNWLDVLGPISDYGGVLSMISPTDPNTAIRIRYSIFLRNFHSIYAILPPILNQTSPPAASDASIGQLLV